MGDYYKYKKILVILMIISCGFSIIKNIFKTKVEASEAVEVTPVWNDGSYTYQADNQFLTLRQNQIDIQNYIIFAFYNMYDRANDTDKTNIKNRLYNIYNNIYSGDNSGNNAQFVWFTRLSTYNNSNFGYQIVKASNLNNIVYNDATLDNGYKILSVPFYSFTRNTATPLRVVHRSNGTLVSQVSSGDALVPVAELGCYSTLWVDLFKYVGILSNDNDYNAVLTSIETTNEENYTANLYTKQAVENTYNYLNNENVDTISSTGITQPEVSQPDLSDTFDTLTDLLTNENYHNKNFILTLPNNDKFNFSIDPDFLKTSLTRVGGSNLVTIIQTLWYIGLYGIMIFLSLKIIGSLLAGDLDSVVGSLSPVNSVVNSSLECTGAFKLGDNHDGAFRRR